MTIDDPRPARYAPVHHYVLAILFAVIVTLVASFAVAFANRAEFWLSAGIVALSGAYPALSLGMRLFVSDHTVTRDAHGDRSVEVVWLRQAAAGAFVDVLAATVLAAVALLVTRIAVEPVWLLAGLVVLSAADAGVRYLVIRYRALR